MSIPTVGDVQRQMPKPDQMKNVVKYKGPNSNQAVLKQAATNSELQKAVEAGDAEMMKAILRYGSAKRCVNVNAPLWPKRERMLHLAAQKGFRDVGVLLLEAKAEIDAEEICDGKHPIHEACKHGHYDVCELLLDRKAHIEEATFTGMRPLHWAAAEGHAEICDMLLDRKAVLYATSGDTREAIHHAAANGHADVIETLCRRGARPDVEAGGHRPLHLACLNGQCGHLAAVKALLDYGALSSLEDFGSNGTLRRCQGTDIEALVRRIGQLNLQIDEAEEMDDMGQHEEAREAYTEVLTSFDELGMIRSAESLRSSMQSPEMLPLARNLPVSVKILPGLGADETCLHIVEDADGMQLASSNSSSCTVFRFNGASILAKAYNSCLSWADTWKLVPCASKSLKFAQRALPKEEDIYCAGKRKQLCVQAVEYMCTTDPGQCSMGDCRCEDASHVRKEMQTVNRSLCQVCGPPVPNCPMSSDSCVAGPCECPGGFVKVSRGDDCFSCTAGPAPPTGPGVATFSSLASAIVSFLCCVGLGVAVACAARRCFVVEDADNTARTRRRRRNVTPRTWSERWALHLEEALEAVCKSTRSWRPFRSATAAVINFFDMCDDALFPVYELLETGLDSLQRGAATIAKAAVGTAREEHFSLIGSVLDALGPALAVYCCDRAFASASNFQVLEYWTKEGHKAAPRAFQHAHAEKEPIPCDSFPIPEARCDTLEGLLGGVGANVRSSARNCSTPRERMPMTEIISTVMLVLLAEVDANLAFSLCLSATAAMKAAQQAVQTPAEQDLPVDDSWIDDIERKEVNQKEANGERAAALRRERKHAVRARRARSDNEGMQDTENDKTDDQDLGAGGKKSERQDKLLGEEHTMQWANGIFLLAEESDTGAEDEVRQVKKADMEDPQQNLPHELEGSKSYEVEEASEGEGWIKSSSMKVRGARRRGEMQAEQEPAAEPDPQPEAESNKQPADLERPQSDVSQPDKTQPQTPQTPQTQQTADAPNGLSKRQRQRIRQRQAGEDARASGRKPDPRHEARRFCANYYQLDARFKVLPHALDRRQAASKMEKGEEAMTLPAPESATPVAVETTEADAPASRAEKEAYRSITKAVVRDRQMSQHRLLQTSWQGDRRGSRWASGAMGMESQHQEMSRSFDFLHVVNGTDGRTAFVNFIDPVFVMLFSCICQEYSFQGNVSMSDVHGLQALKAHWAREENHSTSQPVILPDARPTQWAVNAVNHMLSPHPLKYQFRKTKMCAYNKKKMCEMGTECPFAHSRGELQPMPDLAKTKMCYNYFQRRCADAHCKFAHGSAELRSVWTRMPCGTWPVEEASNWSWDPLGEEIQPPWSTSSKSRDEGDAALFETLPREGKTRTSSDEGNVNDFALRVRNGFLEVMQVDTDDEEDTGMQHSIKRSFSDSHIATLKEAMHEARDL
ncbi:Ank2 [Symbiodinium sp. CCMP2456]|nr:Ank2 [Symbiodinium sp. CCMP2456]